MHERFRKFARKTSDLLGTTWVFLLALAIVLIWAASGPMFNFSSNWQLVINTSTTIVTFLMVFIIQNTQNRDAKALHLKLDELIDSMEDARDELVDIEDATDEELEQRQREYAGIRASANSAGNN